MESEVRELLIEELKDAYSAEKQALRCMQKTLRKASAPALKVRYRTSHRADPDAIERLAQGEDQKTRQSRAKQAA
jgi:ferritin-like metal-binding protein YciE